MAAFLILVVVFQGTLKEIPAIISDKKAITALVRLSTLLATLIKIGAGVIEVPQLLHTNTTGLL